MPPARTAWASGPIMSATERRVAKTWPEMFSMIFPAEDEELQSLGREIAPASWR